MIEEIIYTSAQKGLRAGRRGFCTVVSTAGMALNTAERLESMSGYRHAFSGDSAATALNPVNYSHVTTRIGGQLFHIVSRVADAGQDYSGRTNKLAHHLLLNDVGRYAGGPVRLMDEPSVLVSQWDGNLRTIPPRNLPVPESPKSVTLSAWKKATGDSGWAGWVAERLTQDKVPVSVIFPAGCDTLSLVREVLDVLPPAQRWSVTFSTYFTRLLAGTECQLRLVLDGTSEATALRNDARAKVIDLTARLAAAQGASLVAAARTGVVTHADTGIASLRDVPVKSTPGKTSADLVIPVRAPVLPGKHRPGRGPGVSSSNSAPELDWYESGDDRSQSETSSRRGKRKWLIPVIAGVAILLIGGVAGIGVWTWTKQPPVAQAQVSRPDSKGADNGTATSPTATTGDSGPTTDAQAPSSDPATSAASAGDTSIPPERKHDPFKLAMETRDSFGQILFEVPKSSDPQTVKELPLDLENSVELTVAAFPGFNKAISDIGVSVEYVVAKPPDQWDVVVKRGEAPTPMATLKRKRFAQQGATDHLTFQWKPSADKQFAALVSWCPMVISVNETTSVCILRQPCRVALPATKELFLASGWTQPQSLEDEFGPLEMSKLSKLTAGDGTIHVDLKLVSDNAAEILLAAKSAERSSKAVRLHNNMLDILTEVPPNDESHFLEVSLSLDETPKEQAKGMKFIMTPVARHRLKAFSLIEHQKPQAKSQYRGTSSGGSVFEQLQDTEWSNEFADPQSPSTQFKITAKKLEAIGLQPALSLFADYSRLQTWRTVAVGYTTTLDGDRKKSAEAIHKFLRASKAVTTCKESIIAELADLNEKPQNRRQMHDIARIQELDGVKVPMTDYAKSLVDLEGEVNKLLAYETETTVAELVSQMKKSEASLFAMKPSLHVYLELPYRNSDGAGLGETNSSVRIMLLESVMSDGVAP